MIKAGDKVFIDVNSPIRMRCGVLGIIGQKQTVIKMMDKEHGLEFMLYPSSVHYIDGDGNVYHYKVRQDKQELLKVAKIQIGG